MARATSGRIRSRRRSRRSIAGLRVYTIGFGTENPGGRPPRCGAASAASRATTVSSAPAETSAAGFGGTGGGFRRAIDEETLTAVAEATGGEYYPAESAEQLNEVFEQLPTDLITSHKVVEISVAVHGARTVLIALAILLGQAWRPLP